MNVPMKHKTKMLAAVVLTIGGSLYALEHFTGLIAPGFINLAHAQESGGHDEGSGDSGGHGGGGESGGSGGHGGGGESGGGHDSGGGESGGEAKGHGTKYKHEGHGGGQHGAASAHEAGGDRFGGGSGLRGNNQVPEGIGRYGQGFSELSPTDEGRFRYWGGFTLPEAPPTPDPTTDPALTTTTDFTPGPGGGPSVNVRSALDTSPRCEGVASNMPAAQQFSGGNLLRLNAARGLVDPALAASGKIASPYLMASLQNELVKGAPNTELAGTYLGLVAKAPVTADTVKKIGFQLCARMSDAQAKEIAQVAEQQRLVLVKAKTDEGTKNAQPQ